MGNVISESLGKNRISKKRSGRRKRVSGPEAASGVGQRLSPAGPVRKETKPRSVCQGGAGFLTPRPLQRSAPSSTRTDTPGLSVSLTLRGHLISQRDAKRRLFHRPLPPLRLAVFNVSAHVTGEGGRRCPGTDLTPGTVRSLACSTRVECVLLCEGCCFAVLFPLSVKPVHPSAASDPPPVRRSGRRACPLSACLCGTHSPAQTRPFVSTCWARPRLDLRERCRHGPRKRSP